MTLPEVGQTTRPGPADEDLIAWDWLADLIREERSTEWLARRTDRSLNSVAAYRQGRAKPSLAWLRSAWIVLNGGRL